MELPACCWQVSRISLGPSTGVLSSSKKELSDSSLTLGHEGWWWAELLLSSAGVQIHERTSVSHVSVQKGRVTGVETDRGHIKCQYFVNCAGQVGLFNCCYPCNASTQMVFASRSRAQRWLCCTNLLLLCLKLAYPHQGLAFLNVTSETNTVFGLDGLDPKKTGKKMYLFKA